MGKFTIGAAVMLTAAACSGTSGAAVIFAEGFDGPSLAAGLTAVNNPTISGGIATLNGSNAANTASGFKYVVPSFPGNYIMEAVIASPFTGTAASLDAIFDAVGNENLRYKTATSLEITCSDNTDNGYRSTTLSGTAASILTAGADVALVISSTSVAFYLNGVYIAKTADAPSIANAPTVNTLAWGYDAYTPNGGSGWRGFNGSFDAIALSTFDAGADPTALPTSAFAFVPEPSAALGLVVPALLGVRRQRREPK